MSFLRESTKIKQTDIQSSTAPVSNRKRVVCERGCSGSVPPRSHEYESRSILSFTGAKGNNTALVVFGSWPFALPLAKCTLLLIKYSYSFLFQTEWDCFCVVWFMKKVNKCKGIIPLTLQQEHIELWRDQGLSDCSLIHPVIHINNQYFCSKIIFGFCHSSHGRNTKLLTLDANPVDLKCEKMKFYGDSY